MLAYFLLSSDSNPLIMQLRKGQIIELEIYALAFGGAGLGKYEGLTVFVEKTMPGDKVQAAFTQIKPNFARADLVKILESSPKRQKARCPYFGVCGGCQLQFMPYEEQLKLKQQQVVDSFERIGKIKNPPVLEIIGCEEIFYYRNKMEFTFGHDSEMNFALGMHLPNRRYDVLDLKECYLQSELSVVIVNAVRDFVIKVGWKPYRVTTNEGFLKLLTIREAKRNGEIMINLATSEEEPKNIEEEFQKFVEALLTIDAKKIVSIYWSKSISHRGKPNQIKEKLLYGKKTIREKMILANGDELIFDILPQAFFQVNTAQAEILYSQILKMAKEILDDGGSAIGHDGSVIFDLFCGTGTIGMFLAKYVEQVVGIELNEDAVKIANENAKNNKIFNIDFYTGNIEKVVPNLKIRPSLIVVDPPRVGLTKKLIEQISEFNAKNLIYVSCNPATLARDYDLLNRYGFRIEKIQPVDLFPHTFHIENVCLLRR